MVVDAKILSKLLGYGNYMQAQPTKQKFEA